MKRKVRLVLLGALLQGSAHAGEPPAVTKPTLAQGKGKAGVVQPVAHKAKKSKLTRKRAKPAEADKAQATSAPVVQEKQETVIETPVEQNVQLKGVRG